MYDLVVIGSGPGGYIGAIRAAQLGMKVACVEKYSSYGGTCLNVGCIPSKALLESSERFEEVQHALSDHGVEVGDVKLNLAKMQERKAGIVSQLTGGVAFLFKKNKIDGFTGVGTIKDKNTVEVNTTDGKQTLETKRILIATGSKPSSVPGVEIDKDRIVDSTGALLFEAVPEHLIVIGAGVIGLELGSVWGRLGAKVTVLEWLPKVLGPADDEVAKAAQRTFKKQGLEFVLDVKVTSAASKDGKVEVTYEPKAGGDPQTISGDRLLVATGRYAYTTGLGLEDVGVKTDDRGRVLVDENFQTNVEGIYAIGDVVPGMMLAHKAEEEAVVCVERMNDIGAHINYEAVPSIVYTHPEVAWIGKTEEELKAAGVEYKKGKFPFGPNGRAKALNATDGFVKILADAKTDRLLGAHIFGIRAGDMIAELAVAVEFGGSSEDIARSSHAHPTLAEIIKEAALNVDGRALNM